MSHWFHIRGMITVCPFGRSQHEKRYVLDSVLAHLPVVQGSEGGMHVHVVQRSGTTYSSSLDEYDCHTNNGIDIWDYDIRSYEGWFLSQREYILVLEADLRDVYWSEGVRMLTKWLCRLSSRIGMDDIMLKCYDGWNTKRFFDPEPFDKMMTDPSWWDSPDRWAPPGVTQNWCEHLMWKPEDNPYWY